MATNIGIMDSAYFVGRSEILAWINSTLHLNLSKVEEVISSFLHIPVGFNWWWISISIWSLVQWNSENFLGNQMLTYLDDELSKIRHALEQFIVSWWTRCIQELCRCTRLISTRRMSTKWFRTTKFFKMSSISSKSLRSLSLSLPNLFRI